MNLIEISDNARENWELIVNPTLTSQINSLYSGIDEISDFKDCSKFSRQERAVLIYKIKKLNTEIQDFQKPLKIHQQKLNRTLSFLVDCQFS